MIIVDAVLTFDHGAMCTASASGTVLGQVFKGPQGNVASGDKEVQQVPTLEVPHTPLAGAVTPGNIDDPSSPAYGILKD